MSKHYEEYVLPKELSITLETEEQWDTLTSWGVIASRTPGDRLKYPTSVVVWPYKDASRYTFGLADTWEHRWTWDEFVTALGICRGEYNE